MIFIAQSAKESVRGGRSCKRVRKASLGLIGFALIMLLQMPAFAEVLYDAGARRNPFVPLVSDDGALKDGRNRLAAGEYNVEGIIFDPREGSFALINGRFYKTGDQIDSAQLISILKDRVILFVNDSEKIVWLREERAGLNS